MPYSTVVAGTTITSSWANTNVRDQVLTPFTNAAARTSAITSPVEGMVSYLADVNRFDFYNGAVWQPVAGVASRVARSTDMTINAGAGNVSVEWNVVSYDSFGMFSGGSPTRLTAPWTGFYTPSASVSWNQAGFGEYRRCGLYKQDTTVEDQQSAQLNAVADTNPIRQNVVASGVYLTAGQFFTVQVAHDAGISRLIEASLSNFKLAYLGPAA